MYGKIFDSIYDGTLRANWKALITFQQFIILAGPDGVIDMTPHAIHGRTGIPLDIIEEGIQHLAQPDPYSRSTTEDGRRIVLIDQARPWGWRLVNHAYYQKLITREDKRKADRERIAEKRSTSLIQAVRDRVHSASKKFGGGNIEPQYALALLNGYGRICGYCNTDLSIENLSFDHIVPQKSGGRHVIENLMPCCITCNLTKGIKALADFLSPDEAEKILKRHSEIIVEIKTSIESETSQKSFDVEIVADVAHADAYADSNTKKITTLSGKPDVAPLELRKNGKALKADATEILSFLNEKTGRAYRAVPANIDLIVNRLKSGVSVQDCKTMIARKHREWAGDDKMSKFLRPSTLFRASNFEQYIGECV